ncbi:MAG: hypothetical protein AAGC72_03090, partial [Planctomycetota bacterium]
MTNPKQPRLDDATRTELEDYIDGRMTSENREVFERRMQDDPALIAECQLQQRVDDALDRLLTADMQRVASPPSVIRDRLRQSSEAGPKPIKMLSSTVFRWAAYSGIAAAIAIAAVLLLMNTWPQIGYDELQYVEVAKVYQNEVEAGFTPDWVCDNQR